MSRDFKNKFYRTLNLDKKEKDALRFFREIKQEMINEDENAEEITEETN